MITRRQIAAQCQSTEIIGVMDLDMPIRKDWSKKDKITVYLKVLFPQFVQLHGESFRCQTPVHSAGRTRTTFSQQQVQSNLRFFSLIYSILNSLLKNNNSSGKLHQIKITNRQNWILLLKSTTKKDFMKYKIQKEFSADLGNFSDFYISRYIVVSSPKNRNHFSNRLKDVF